MTTNTESRAHSTAIRDLLEKEKEYLKDFDVDRRSALCLSGGGIRSAAFSLGVLQALARAEWLSKFGYLSTVSGGGYIGSWLSAWIHRTGGDVKKVQDELADPVEPQSLESLRASSNYLSPKTGLSGDMLALVSTYVRNLLINWSVMLPLFLATALCFNLLVLAHDVAASHPSKGSVMFARLVAMTALFTISAYTASDVPWGTRHQTEHSWFRRYGFVPILTACIVLSIGFFHEMREGTNPVSEDYWTPGDENMLFAVMLGVVAYAAGTLVGFTYFRPKRDLRGDTNPEPFNAKRCFWLVGTTTLSAIVIVFAMACGYELAFLVATKVSEYFNDWGIVGLRDHVLIMLAIPALLASFSIGNLFQIAISRRTLDDWAREWWGRSGGVWLIAAGAWLFGILLFVITPALLVRLPDEGFLAGAGGLGGIGGIITALIAYYSKTASPGINGANSDSFMAKLSVSLLDLSAFAFILLLMILAGISAYFIVEVPALKVKAMLAAAYIDVDWPDPKAKTAFAAIVFALLVGFSILAAWVVGANRFSLNALYRLRLTRTFLGSSRAERRPHAFTGFDPEDDLKFSELKQHPLHLVNTAFNINTSEGTKAARGSLQDRRAVSFVFSPVGYGCDRWCAGEVPDDITLGSAMTISGAAASPHMGYHTSRAISFVLAFFNLRLGWWFRRPDVADTARSSEPHCPWRALRSEYFAHTGGRGRSIYLSDGGHFENLALYEALRRRCLRIVAVDAGCDYEFEFNDVARVLRLARIDFGIEIECQHGMPTPATARDTKCHHALWKIKYPKVRDDEEPETGIILYIKPVISRDEPLDVLRRAADNKTAKFPHEPTSDQFFDEAQFDAYRCLGLHSGMKAFEGRQFIEVAWLYSGDDKLNPQYPVWDRCRDARLLLNECDGAGRLAGMAESAKSLFQWDSLPATIATLVGTGAAGAVLFNGSEYNFAIVAPPQQASEVAAVILPMVPVLTERGGRFMLPIFAEASTCPVDIEPLACSVGDGKELGTKGGADGQPMRLALDRLGKRMSACGIDASTVDVIGYSSSSEFENASDQLGSWKLNLRLADTRATNVASALTGYEKTVKRWLPDLSSDVKSGYEKMWLGQVRDTTDDDVFVPTAGGINRRVDIELTELGGCNMKDLIGAFLKGDTETLDSAKLNWYLE